MPYNIQMYMIKNFLYIFYQYQYKIPHWYQISKSRYDEFFVKKEYVKNQILSQEELNLLLNAGKYNL